MGTAEMSEDNKPLFKLDINPESIDKVIADAVIKSRLGPKIQEGVDRVLEKYKADYQVRDLIEQEIKVVIRDLLREKIMEQRSEIRSYVEGKITDEMLQQLLDRMWTKLLDRY